MSQYRVKMIANDRSTYVVVMAYNAGDAARLARAQFPTLLPGDIVVMDDRSAHKVAGVRIAIEAVGARVVYLPPYSPDLNPIKLVFSKFKWLVRSAVERSVEGLWHLCGQLLDRFTPTECKNYFRHCGYTATEIHDPL